MSRLALIAGAGGLPAELAGVLPTPPLVCAPEGIAPEGLSVDLAFRVERLAPFMRHLVDTGLTTVCFAGPVHRMRLDPALFDPETATLVPRLLTAMKGGDDATLREVIAIFEDYGLTVEGIAALAPQLLADADLPGTRTPTGPERDDALRGIAILDALASVDVGQACVVASGLCLGLEALFGTDVMLSHVASCRGLREPSHGGVLIKRAKSGQDLRIDLPAIGPDTVAAVQAAGLTGICLQAGHVVILERTVTLARAREAGLALWAVP